MNTRLQRYDTQFLRDFRAPIVVNTKAVEEAVEAPPPPPPPVFKESDMEHAREAAKKMGYAEGFEAGLAQAKTEESNAVRELAHHAEKIEKHVAKLAATYRKLVAEQAEELSALVVMIARKVAGDALDANGEQAVHGLLERCLPLVFGKPKIVLELSPAMLPRMESNLRHQLEQGGFNGDIEFRAVDSMDRSDIRVDWLHGSATRNTAALWQEIEALLATVPLSPTVPNVKLEEKQPDPVEAQGADHG